MHSDIRLAQRIHELGGCAEVGLVGGEDIAARITIVRRAQCVVVLGGYRATERVERRREAIATIAGRRSRCTVLGDLRLQLGDLGGRDSPGVLVAAVDRVLPHAIDVEEEVFLALGRDVEHRVVGGHRVVDGLPEVPCLRGDGVRQVGPRQLVVCHQRDFHRGRASDGFRQQSNHVVEVHRGPQAAIPPRGIAGSRAHGDAWLSFHGEARVHGRAHHVDA